MIKSRTDCTIFVPTLEGGGAERVMLNLSGVFVQKGISVDLVVGKAKGIFLSEVPAGVRLIDFGCDHVRSTLPQMVRYLRHERPVSFLSALNHANILALLANRIAAVQTRVLVTEHNTLLGKNNQKKLSRARFLPFMIGQFYPWADEIVAVSEGVADSLAKHTTLPRERIKVIYNPVITREIEYLANQPLDHPWFGSDGPPVILAIGRLTEQKDFPLLIKSFACLVKRRPARLLILGDGKDRSSLEALIREEGLGDNVLLPGFIPNPYRFLKHADVFVLSSRWEGLPTVLIEALALGIPIVASDCPSGPHEILDGGRYGRLIPQGDMDSLISAINEILDNLDEEKKKAGLWKNRAELFLCDISAEKYQKALFPPSGLPRRQRIQ